jgi:hypothetical protein
MRSGSSMREAFVDPETGWAATRESVIPPKSCVEVIDETVTDPVTGKVYRSRRAAGYPRPISEWVREIIEAKNGWQDFGSPMTVCDPDNARAETSHQANPSLSNKNGSEILLITSHE